MLKALNDLFSRLEQTRFYHLFVLCSCAIFIIVSVSLFHHGDLSLFYFLLFILLDLDFIYGALLSLIRLRTKGPAISCQVVFLCLFLVALGINIVLFSRGKLGLFSFVFVVLLNLAFIYDPIKALIQLSRKGPDAPQKYQK